MFWSCVLAVEIFITKSCCVQSKTCKIPATLYHASCSYVVTTVAAFPRQYCDLQVERLWFSNHQCSFVLLWIHHADAVWFFHLIDENSRFFHGNADQLGWGPVYLGNQLQQAGLGFYGILDYMENLICFHPSTESVKKLGIPRPLTRFSTGKRIVGTNHFLWTTSSPLSSYTRW